MSAQLDGNTASPSKSTPLVGCHILVVDDEIDSRELIAFVLEEEGAIVTCVSSGIEAWQLLTTSKFDVLISDISMPEMDGYMLIQQVRQLLAHSPEIKAIALTANAGATHRQQALFAGFNHHLTKPVDLQKLVAMIVNLTKA
jgi:CheY-like chemotaxis protein